MFGSAALQRAADGGPAALPRAGSDPHANIRIQTLGGEALCIHTMIRKSFSDPSIFLY